MFDPKSVSVTINTDEFEEAVHEVVRAVNDLDEAAEALGDSAVYVENPLSGELVRVEASDMFQIEASIQISGIDDE